MLIKSKGLHLVLKKRECFKLVCGAGNEDAVEVEKLVFLYSLAGANYFDLSAKEDVLLAAYRGIKRAGISKDKCFFNVSVGIKGDPHVNKAKISSKCIACGKCADVCIQKAISPHDDLYKVNPIRCIGCGACVKICPVDAISLFSKPKSLKKILPPLVKIGVDSIELHAASGNDKHILSQWKIIEENFKGILSLCLDRSQLSDVSLLNRIEKLIDGRNKFSTIIQADGAPMSGCDDAYSTTLQALATAQIVERANFPVYLMLSGGTNSRTAEMAKLFAIKAHGVALGSYARKIVLNYVRRKDFFTNKEKFNKALLIAKKLADTTRR